MSALTRFRDHCRAMARARPGEWPPESERRLWMQLADEIDDYLASNLEQDQPPVHIHQDGFDFGGNR